MIRRVPQANLKVACPACGQKLDASDVLAFQHVECPACKSELMIPYRFGQYLLEEPLSESHLAGVYRALDLKLDREVAIKVLDEDLAENEMLVEHFLKLGRRIALLNHSNIIPIYSSGTFKELPYLVMELMEDFSLRDMLHQTDAPPPCDQSLHIAEQVARGLEAANREGVHHHNLNPANILLGPGNVVKLTDFGMAAVWEAAMNEHTEQAGEYPDAGYMSPELLKGEQADCRADIYSLGAILFHMLTGQRPFHEDRLQRMQTPDAIPADSCKVLRPEVPRELSHLVSKMMSPNPAQRPRALHAVIRSLAEHRSHLPNLAYKKGGTADDDLSRKPKPGTRLRGTAQRAERLVHSHGKAMRRKSWLRQVLDALILLLIVILVFLFLYLYFQGTLNPL